MKCYQCKIPIKEFISYWNVSNIKCPECNRIFVFKWDKWLWQLAGKHFRQKVANIHMFLFYIREKYSSYAILMEYCKLKKLKNLNKILFIDKLVKDKLLEIKL